LFLLLPELPPPPDDIVATVVSLLLHAPPGVKSDSVIVAPTHALELPVIAAGTGFTVIGFVVEHPGLAV
jgi:hypothetical protein